LRELCTRARTFVTFAAPVAVISLSIVSASSRFTIGARRFGIAGGQHRSEPFGTKPTAGIFLDFTRRS